MNVFQNFFIHMKVFQYVVYEGVNTQNLQHLNV